MFGDDNNDNDYIVVGNWKASCYFVLILDVSLTCVRNHTQWLKTNIILYAVNDHIFDIAHL